jgi:hypothetical protein
MSLLKTDAVTDLGLPPDSEAESVALSNPGGKKRRGGGSMRYEV